MQISPELLESTCKNAIETILSIFEHATKGTIYTIGPMPELRTIRITSGIRHSDSGEIHWGLPEASDYNPPGKTWQQYRDRPGHILEAMGWCVERQKSWTADNPHENLRSVRKQLRGEIEDCHHMEPVLVRKVDLYGDDLTGLEYPLDWQGNPLWQESEYVVVAVFKFHFLPQTVERGDRTTKIIKKLSRTLGTELLSLHLRETYLEARERLSHERLVAANVIAHELRNTLTKLGFIFSAINTMMSFLRAQWELEVQKAFPFTDRKEYILDQLKQVILQRQPQLDGQRELLQVSRELLAELDELANLYLLPQHGADRLRARIRPRWQRLLAESSAWREEGERIEVLLRRLEEAIWTVVQEELTGRLTHLPAELCTNWRKLAYTQFCAQNVDLLEDALSLLEQPMLHIRQKQQIKKALASLKVLVEIIAHIEEQANRMIYSLKNGDHLPVH